MIFVLSSEEAFSALFVDRYDYNETEYKYMPRDLSGIKKQARYMLEYLASREITSTKIKTQTGGMILTILSHYPYFQMDMPALMNCRKILQIPEILPIPDEVINLFFRKNATLMKSQYIQNSELNICQSHFLISFQNFMLLRLNI